MAHQFVSEEQRKAVMASYSYPGADFKRGLSKLGAKWSRRWKGAISAPSRLAGAIQRQIVRIPTTTVADKAAEAAGVVTETLMKHYLDKAMEFTEHSIAAQVDLAEERWARRMEKVIHATQSAIAGEVTHPHLRAGSSKEATEAYKTARLERLVRVQKGQYKRLLRSYLKQKEIEAQLRQTWSALGKNVIGLDPHTTAGTVAYLTQQARQEDRAKPLIREFDEMKKQMRQILKERQDYEGGTYDVYPTRD